MRRWERNIAGLRKTAQSKAEAPRKRTEEAIQLFLEEKRPVNFKAVAQPAHVSTA